jgi:hypothetical protein
LSRRYFTESCKNNYSIFPHSLMEYDPSVFCRELQKNYSPCHNHRCVSRRTRQIQCARALTPFYIRMCQRTSKNLEGFSKF